MVAIRQERTARSQIGYQANSTSTYTEGGSDVNFNNGQLSYIRMPTQFVKGSTITSATLQFNMIAKNSGTAQSCSNRIRAHASGDSPMLRLGVNEWSNGPRPETASYVDWTPYWPANPPGDLFLTVDVTSIVQEVLSRSDFQTGGYITFIIYTIDETGSDLGFRANNDFAQSPLLQGDFTPPITDVNYTINRCENSEFSTEIQGIEAVGNPVPYWGQGNYFGAFVDPPNLGTIARDTSFTRLPGLTSMRFTCGTPPAETDKRTGPYFPVRQWRVNDPFTFSGWIYISNSIPIGSEMWIGDPFQGQSGTVITARGQWVPFCTQPLVFPNDSGWDVRWPAVGLKNFQAGWQFWISEPTFTNLPFRHMPFNGLTPEPTDSSGIVLLDHVSTASKMQSIREWVPRTAVVRNGVFKKVPHYIKRADGILQLAQPIKGGPQITSLPSTAISALPAGKTVSEL